MPKENLENEGFALLRCPVDSLSKAQVDPWAKKKN